MCGIARVHEPLWHALLAPSSPRLTRPRSTSCFCSGDRFGKGPSLSLGTDMAPPRPCLAGAGPTCQQKPQNKLQRNPWAPSWAGYTKPQCSACLFGLQPCRRLACCFRLPSLCVTAGQKGEHLPSTCLSLVLQNPPLESSWCPQTWGL